MVKYNPEGTRHSRHNGGTQKEFRVQSQSKTKSTACAGAAGLTQTCPSVRAREVQSTLHTRGRTDFLFSPIHTHDTQRHSTDNAIKHKVKY